MELVRLVGSSQFGKVSAENHNEFQSSFAAHLIAACPECGPQVWLIYHGPEICAAG